MPRTSSGRKSSSSEPTTTTGNYPYWPRDLVPQIIPDARVLTFGYDTHIRHSFSRPPSQNRLIDHGGDFLCALEDSRRSQPSRPLLFIAHSLGGLVVKETLRQSKSYEQERPERAHVYLSTIGIIFFGTPHAGADPLNGIHHSLITLINLLGFRANDQIVQTLMPNAERLVMLNEEFISMIHTRNWQIHSFQEEFAQTGLLGKKVVEDSSSRINDRQHEKIEHIQANHVDMCRFDGLEDPEFRKVQAALKFMRKSPTHHSFLTTEQREKISEKLNFDGVDARYMSLGAAQSRTCRWLPESSIYKDWQNVTKLAEHHGFLWIKGKPGAGKSIMMKYLLHRAKKTLAERAVTSFFAKETLAERVVISFFFNARGDELERSTQGMYRSLLIQLLQKLSRTRLDSEALFPFLSRPDDNRWPIEALKQAFQSVVSQADSLDLCCYIDALDECSEDEVREMIYFFEDIGKQAVESKLTFRVCFSSRHYPHISIEKGLELTLENEPDHTNDIRQYIQSKLRIKEQDKKQKIEAEVLHRSANIFLWAALVVDILNKEYDKGLNPTLKRLKQIPDGLHRLFEDILTRDNENIDELVLCLQWILFAKRPLRPEELYTAVRLGSDSANSSFWDGDHTRSEMIGRFNLNVSKGLAEITKTNPTVQFIHESVRDYLMREDGLRTLLGRRKETAGDVEGLSNEVLKQVCLAQLRDQIESKVLIPDELPRAPSAEAKSLRREVRAKFPFLGYAIDHVLSHANSAQRGGIDQTSFFSSFSRQRWIRFDNLLQKHQTCRHSNDAPLIYLLAEHVVDHQSLGNLIQIHPERHLGLTLSTKSERYNLPMSAALAWGNHDAIRTLAIEAAKQGTSPTDDILISKIQEELSDLSRFKPDRDNDQWENLDGQTALALLKSTSLLDVLQDELFRPDSSTFPMLIRYCPTVTFAQRFVRYGDWFNTCCSDGHTALTFAVHNDLVDLAKYLLSLNADHSSSKDGFAPLYYARSIEMVKACHEHGANPYNISPHGMNFLHRALKMNRPEALSLIEYALGEIGIDIYSTIIDRRNSISVAAMLRSIEIVHFLHRFDKLKIDWTDDTGRTFLSHASGTLNYEVVRYLIELGADPNIPDTSGKTPLWHAASYMLYEGDDRVIKALLGNPLTNPNLADKEGRTPLLRAAQLSHLGKVQSLMEDSRTDLAVKCKKGRTSISYAQEPFVGIEDTLNLLLEKTSLDPDDPDFEGKTPLMYACGYLAYGKVRALLATQKVNVNAEDKNGWTPIWHLLRGEEGNGYNGRKSLQKLLASKAVDPLVIVAGQTPLDFAKSKHCKLVRDKDVGAQIVEILSLYVEEWVSIYSA